MAVAVVAFESGAHNVACRLPLACEGRNERNGGLERVRWSRRGEGGSGTVEDRKDGWRSGNGRIDVQSLCMIQKSSSATSHDAGYCTHS